MTPELAPITLWSREDLESPEHRELQAGLAAGGLLAESVMQGWTGDRWRIRIPSRDRCRDDRQVALRSAPWRRAADRYGVDMAWAGDESNRSDWDLLLREERGWAARRVEYYPGPLNRVRRALARSAVQERKLLLILEDDVDVRRRADPRRYDEVGYTTRVAASERDLGSLLRRCELLFRDCPPLCLIGLGLSEEYPFYKGITHSGRRVMRVQIVHPGRLALLGGDAGLLAVRAGLQLPTWSAEDGSHNGAPQAQKEMSDHLSWAWSNTAWDDLHLCLEVLLRGGLTVTLADWYCFQPGSCAAGGATWWRKEAGTDGLDAQRLEMVRRYPGVVSEGRRRGRAGVTSSRSGWLAGPTREGMGLQFGWQKATELGTAGRRVIRQLWEEGRWPT